MKPIWCRELLANILCAIIMYGLLSPRHDFAVIQLSGSSKAGGFQRKVERRQGGIKMT
jgi:hypothetical protein